ncbi:NUDIX domain-containing protein [Pseudogemmobacter sp. W21_MBD1_M6]|uniref:NUDIX domain-containing protein n=1 Tax=Pseudogemmobacter sp. W21_MBD1_M6 TaxID=3240271 RepID=UPI003F96ACE6
MKNLFFYGTLRYRPLLDLVLGDAGAALTLTPATLDDHAVYWASGQCFPMIVPAQGAVAQGLLAEGLTDAAIARLNFYEGGFAYDLHDLQVGAGARTVTAGVYIPQDGHWTAGPLWSLTDWATLWGALTRYAATEVMSYYGTRPPEDVARMFPMIRSRAASRVRAETAPMVRVPPQTATDVEVLDITRGHVSFFATDEYLLRHKTIAGDTTPPLLRTVFVHVDAVIVLPYDPLRDRVLLVEQFRLGPFARGDADCWMLEAVAGMVDAGETPEEAAMREMHEEAGVTPLRLIRHAACYPTPGADTEFHTHYIAICDLPDGHHSAGGLDSEHEDLRLHVLSFDALMDMLAQGMLRNAPLILAVQALARMRDPLRLDA